MDGRILVLLLCLASLSAQATEIKRCTDNQGRIAFVDGDCPAGMHPTPYELPAVNLAQAPHPVKARVNSESRSPNRARRGSSRVPRCRRLKARFRKTREACRGIGACRKRAHLRQRLRAAYKYAFCMTRTGAIDSR